jgi:hypothetical protein
MAYNSLSIQTIIKDGLEPVYGTATLTDGDRFRNSGKEFVHVINGGGSPCLVTIPTPATISGLDIEDKVVTVPAGEDRMIGTFEPGLYNQPAGGTDAGELYVEYDQVTTVTVAVIRP